LNFQETVKQALLDVMEDKNMKDLYSTAANFLITADMMDNQIGTLSEGQKGLLCYARFVLQKPGILIMDEPTNHINFRHLPVIAQALVDYEGAMIIISHDEGFVKQLGIEEILDLGKL